ncbi:MAG: hypothetical protein MI725_06365, partial [Pirellulales bacterium]|nr:hypothetical protein [Pirellulales bacterium]
MSFLKSLPRAMGQLVLLQIATTWLGLSCTLPCAAQQSPSLGAGESAELRDELVTEIRIVGNDTIPTIKIAGQLESRVGRPFRRSTVQGDVRRLASLGWFIDVKPLSQTTPQGRIVIFQVVERPTIRYVTYLGNEKDSDKNLTKQTK